MSLFDLLAHQKKQNEYYEDFEDIKKGNKWLYALITAMGITFIFSSFFLTQIDRLLGESKMATTLFKEDGEPTLVMNFIQLLIVYIILLFISKW